MTTRVTTLALLASLALPCPVAAQLQEPAALARVRDSLAANCRSSGGAPSFGPGFLLRANITPDGRVDYVVDPSGMGCEGGENPACGGSGGCDVYVVASVRGAYRLIYEGTARHVALRRGRDRDTLLLTRHDSSCPPNRPACQLALAWNGRRMASR